jgi:hypothetical protein
VRVGLLTNPIIGLVILPTPRFAWFLMFPIQIVFLTVEKKPCRRLRQLLTFPHLPEKIPVGEWGNFLRPPLSPPTICLVFHVCHYFWNNFCFPNNEIIDTIIKFSVLLNDISTKNFNVLENSFSDNMWCKDSEFMNEVHNQL